MLFRSVLVLRGAERAAGGVTGAEVEEARAAGDRHAACEDEAPGGDRVEVATGGETERPAPLIDPPPAGLWSELDG